MKPFRKMPSLQSVTKILILLIIGHGTVNASSRRATTAWAAKNELNLRQIVQKEYHGSVDNLSSLQVTQMLSPPGEKKRGELSSTNRSYTNNEPLRQQLFTLPIIPLLYERILPPLWSAGLRIGGPDAEYESAADFLYKNNNENEKSAESTKSGLGIGLDLSCGTGFVAIRMAQSNMFQHVIGLDYSPQMLQEGIATIQRQRLDLEGNKNGRAKNSRRLSWIRGDAGSLPFEDESFDVIHWGAAMHCVPDVEAAMEEVYRVLKPGGKLYATTFLRPFPDVVFRFFDLVELETLAKNAGFAGSSSNSDDQRQQLEVEGRGVYGIIRAVK